MSETILSFLYGSGLTVALFGIVIFISKNFIKHQFDKQIEAFKSELQAKHQEQQHFHELLIQSISQENKELNLRKLDAIDHLWKSILSMKKFSMAVKFLGTLNFNEIKKRASDPKIQKFLNMFPQCTFAELLKETESTKEHPPELARPWITHRAWSLYLAYIMVIYYAVSQFESAKAGGSLDGVFDENKLLEIIQKALPDANITKLCPSLLKQLNDLLELALIIELKTSIESKEDSIAIERAKTIFTLSSDIKSQIKLNDIN